MISAPIDRGPTMAAEEKLLSLQQVFLQVEIVVMINMT
jgi:hypothetical protein